MYATDGCFRRIEIHKYFESEAAGGQELCPNMWLPEDTLTCKHKHLGDGTELMLTGDDCYASVRVSARCCPFSESFLFLIK